MAKSKITQIRPTNQAADTNTLSLAQVDVVVRRQWNDWREATYRLSDLSEVRWDWVSGGVRARTPQPFLHAYVVCDAKLEGELAHSGSHGPCPHLVKVCIVKKDNAKPVFDLLVERAGPKPKR